jgi:hypothetical protein
LTAEANEQIRIARTDADTAEKHYSELVESAVICVKNMTDF